MAKKNAAAVELGRRGGKVKVPKGTATLSPEERTERAKAAAAARWGTKKSAKKTDKLAKILSRMPK
jgi:hypothetical protein